MTIIYKKMPLIRITINENIGDIENRFTFTITKDLFEGEIK